MSSERSLDAARRYATAMTTGDDEAMRALFDPSAEVWHNTDGATQSIDDNLRAGRWLRRKVPGIVFADIRHTITEDGFVQRHRMTGELTGGGVLDAPSCLVVSVTSGGLIARVEEYLDSAALSVLWAPAEPSHGPH